VGQDSSDVVSHVVVLEPKARSKVGYILLKTFLKCESLIG